MASSYAVRTLMLLVATPYICSVWGKPQPRDDMYKCNAKRGDDPEDRKSILERKIWLGTKSAVGLFSVSLLGQKSDFTENGKRDTNEIEKKDIWKCFTTRPH